MNNENHTDCRFEVMPPAPDSLSEGALKHWAALLPAIVELETGRPADIPVLVMLVEMMADVDALQDAIRQEGHTIEAGSGGRKAHPALRSLEATRRQAQDLLGKFGLMPGCTPRAANYYDY